MTTPNHDIYHYVGKYVQLRDKIRALDDEHKKKMAPYREMLEQLSGVLLQQLETVGGESVRTDAGTCYRTEKRTASLADADAFMRYIRETGAFDLLDRKANVTAVFDFVKEHNSPPPGVSLSTRFEVGVRRPTK